VVDFGVFCISGCLGGFDFFLVCFDLVGLMEFAYFGGFRDFRGAWVWYGVGLGL